MPDLPVDDVLERIEAVLNFPADAPTEYAADWKRAVASRIVAALGVMYVGSECQSCGTLQGNTRPARSCCPEPHLSVPVYRFGNPMRDIWESEGRGDLSVQDES